MDTQIPNYIDHENLERWSAKSTQELAAMRLELLKRIELYKKTAEMEAVLLETLRQLELFIENRLTSENPSV